MTADIIKVEGFELLSSKDGVLRVRDVEIGQRLGYARTRDVRTLIKRLIDGGTPLFSDVVTRGAVQRVARRDRGTVSIESTEYWLTREQALKVCLKSETPEADAVQDDMIRILLRVFDTATARLDDVLGGPMARFLLGVSLKDWELTWWPSLVSAVCKVYRIPWRPGSVHPPFMAGVIRDLYRLLPGDTRVYDRMKQMSPKPRHGENLHQGLKPGVPTEWLREQLKVVEVLANQSEDRIDFWRRVERNWGRQGLQLSLVESKPKRLK